MDIGRKSLYFVETDSNRDVYTNTHIDASELHKQSIIKGIDVKAPSMVCIQLCTRCSCRFSAREESPTLTSPTLTGLLSLAQERTHFV